MTWPRPAPLASMSRKTSGTRQRQGHRRAERDQHERRPGPARPDRPRRRRGRAGQVLGGHRRITVIVLVSHEQPGLAHQVDGRGAGAQLGDRDRVGPELAERRLGRLGRDPGGQRVLEADRLAGAEAGGADDLLRLPADQEGQELLGLGLVLARLQHRRPGHVDDVAGVAGREVGDQRVHLGRAVLRSHPVPVVLIYHAKGDGSLVDLGRDRLVIRVDVPGRVGLDRRQPLERGGLAVGAIIGGDDGLEVGLLRGQGQLALVLRDRPAG